MKSRNCSLVNTERREFLLKSAIAVGGALVGGIALSACGSGGGDALFGSSGADKTANLVVTGFGGKTIFAQDIQKTTVLAAVHSNLPRTTVEFKNGDPFLFAIGDLANNRDSQNWWGWQFTLNGIQVQKPPDKIVLQPGDKLVWYFAPSQYRG